MKQIKEETRLKLIQILAHGKHPNYTWADIQQYILELEQLQPVKEEKEQQNARVEETDNNNDV